MHFHAVRSGLHRHGFEHVRRGDDTTAPSIRRSNHALLRSTLGDDRWPTSHTLVRTGAPHGSLSAPHGARGTRQTGDVHAGLDQTLRRGNIEACRTNGADDFRFTHEREVTGLTHHEREEAREGFVRRSRSTTLNVRGHSNKRERGAAKRRHRPENARVDPALPRMLRSRPLLEQRPPYRGPMCSIGRSSTILWLLFALWSLYSLAVGETLRLHAGEPDGGTAVQSSSSGAERTARFLEPPRKARELLQVLQERQGTPLPGYVGGREFRNREGRLPRGRYREYDVNPTARGRPRDAERIVIEQRTQKAYYTPDHYRTFIPLN